MAPEWPDMIFSAPFATPPAALPSGLNNKIWTCFGLFATSHLPPSSDRSLGSAIPWQMFGFVNSPMPTWLATLVPIAALARVTSRSGDPIHAPIRVLHHVARHVFPTAHPRLRSFLLTTPCGQNSCLRSPFGRLFFNVHHGANSWRIIKLFARYANRGALRSSCTCHGHIALMRPRSRNNFPAATVT